MDAFLNRLQTPAIQSVCVGLDELWNGWVVQLNARLQAEGLSVQVANLCFLAACRAMQADGRWDAKATSNKAIKRA